MNLDHSSTRSRSSSSNPESTVTRSLLRPFVHDFSFTSLIPALLYSVLYSGSLAVVGLSAIALSAGCGTAVLRTPMRSRPVDDATANPVALKREVPVPPWQLWSTEPLLHPGLAAANTLENDGRFEMAMKAYRDVELRESPGRDREEAFSRRVGTLLKLGRSRVALEQITAHLKANGRSTADISPILALLAACSYEHQGDVDQTFAWLGVTHKRAQGQGIVARRAGTEATKLLRSLPSEKFESVQHVWGTDAFIGPLLAQEQARRTQGGRNDPLGGPDWFRPETYGAELATEGVREADLSPTTILPDTSGHTVVGVLLPQTGKYAEQANRVKAGIELAREESGIDLSVEYVDTAADANAAESGYDRLVQQGASVVLGPLLVRDAEQVAEHSKAPRVPFVTFTKRPGVTELSPVAFRLGVTADNQVNEVIRYAIDELHLKTFAIALPADDAGAEEYRRAFSEAVKKAGGKAAGEIRFRARDESSVRAAVEQLALSRPDAVFVAEEIDRAAPLFRGIKSSSIAGATLLGPATWNDPVALRGFSNLMEGAVFATPFYIGSSKPSVSDFVRRYHQRFGEDPDLLAAQAFDVARLTFERIKAGANASGTKVSADDLMKRLLGADTIDGVTGKLSVGKNREITRRMSIVRMYRGETVEVMNGGNVTGFLPNEPSQEEKGT